MKNLVRDSSYILSIAFLGGFLFFPNMTLFCVGLGLLGIHILLGEAKVFAFLLYALTFRGVGLFGTTPRSSLINLYDPILVLLLMHLLLQIMRGKKRFLSLGILMPSLVFLFTLIPSFFVADQVSRSIVEFSRFVLGISLFLAVILYVNKSVGRMQMLLRLLKQAATFAIMLAVIDYVGQSFGRADAAKLGPLFVSIPNWVLDPRGGFVRVVGYWNDPDYLGAFVGAALLTIGISSEQNRSGFAWPVYLLGVFVIYATKSGTLAAAFVFCICLSLLVTVLQRRSFNLRIVGAGLTATFLVIFVASLFLFVSTTQASAPSIGLAELTGRPMEHYLRSLNTRFYLWERAVGFFAARPLLGSGLDSFRVLATSGRDWWRSIAPVPHNSWLQLAVGGGSLALVGWLILLGGIAWRAPISWRKGYHGLVFGVLFSFIFGIAFEYYTARVFWLMLGLLVAASYTYTQSRYESDPSTRLEHSRTRRRTNKV